MFHPLALDNAGLCWCLTGRWPSHTRIYKGRRIQSALPSCDDPSSPIMNRLTQLMNWLHSWSGLLFGWLLFAWMFP